jgi:exodeoxyribonuclease-5
VRDGQPLSTFPGRNEEVQIIDKYNLTSGMYKWADQIICATNRTRQDINSCIRQLDGRGPEPEVGDKIIGLTNHWNFLSACGAPLTNGSIGKITEVEPFDIKVPFWIYPNEIIKALRIDMHAEDDELFQGIPADYLAITTGQKTLTGQQEFQMNKAKNILFPPPFDFAYAYAITCWKAQGSEWDKVLLLEENFPFNREDHIKYLYTGITRSSKKLLVVKK